MSCVDYWDSYWIIQGLLKSELYDIANSTLQNFMDEINTFGFIPNGGRIYCELASALAWALKTLQVLRLGPVAAPSLHAREWTVSLWYNA